MNDKEQLIIRVPLKVKQDLKIIAVKKNTSMNQILYDLIVDYIDKNKPS